MKRLVCAAVLSGVASIAAVNLASAQEVSREDAVRQCVAQAQREAPGAGDPTDPASAARYGIFSNCMRRLGHRP
ncbi:MAG: hypothetical protein JWN93_1428 [Hyphomicrobiales bacterium]|nr:hypothetical protein [Hyphomicrobiales bacterium]